MQTHEQLALATAITDGWAAAVDQIVVLLAQLTMPWEVERALTRLLVGVVGVSTADCEWYESIAGDAIEELQAALDRRYTDGSDASGGEE
jgi:hypothetical protein